MMNKTFEGRPLGLVMQSNRNVVIFVSLLLQLLMVGATAAPLADQVNPMGNYDKMNYDLQQELYDSSVDTVLPVIFQLNSPVTDADLAQFEEFGATVLGDAPLVDGGLIEAKPKMSDVFPTGIESNTSNLTRNSISFTCHLNGVVTQLTQVP